MGMVWSGPVGTPAPQVRLGLAMEAGNRMMRDGENFFDGLPDISEYIPTPL